MVVDEKKCEKGLGLVRGMKVLYIAKEVRIILPLKRI